MAGYTKLFNSILDSTIWQEANETRLLWITMLAMSDLRGEVQASVPGLAKRAGIPLDKCKEALATLSGPDEYSRTKDFDGRRVREIDGGWALLNHGRYRALMSKEERTEYNRRKKAEERSRKREVNDMSMTVNDSQQSQHISDTDTEEDIRKHPPTPPEGGECERGEIIEMDLQMIAEAEVAQSADFTADYGSRPEGATAEDRYETVCRYAVAIAPTLAEPAERWMVEEFVDHFDQYQWRAGKFDKKIRDWKAAFRNFIRDKPRTAPKTKRPA